MALRDTGFRVVNVACGLGRQRQHARREAELREACRLAGFELRVPDAPVGISGGDDHRVAAAQLLALVRTHLEDVVPDLVVSPAPHERHRGHELVGRAVRDALAGQSGTRWWMWSVWAPPALPTLGTGFGEERLEKILTALAAHRGELERNDYLRLVRSRAEANAVLGSELLSGFGTADGAPFAELLTEVVVGDSGRWLLGRPRWLDPVAALQDPGEADVGAWLSESSPVERFGL